METRYDRWSLDLIPEHLITGERIEILTIFDMIRGSSPAIIVQTALTPQEIAAMLADRIPTSLRPTMLFVDNGSTFPAHALDAAGVLETSRTPAAPTPAVSTRPAAIERFQQRFRNECLRMHACASVAELQAVVDRWRMDYNTRQ